MTNLQTVFGAIFGHAVGDALGVPTEFMMRERLQLCPVTDMIGFGSHNVPKGSWSDDTSMELCTLHSIARKGTIDLDDIMTEFRQWVEDGYMTPGGTVFDIGRTCLRAITNYCRGCPPTECGRNSELDNGNGSLMRILPVTLYNILTEADDDACIANVEAVSALTHRHKRSCIACGIYDFVVREVIHSPGTESVNAGLAKASQYYKEEEELGHYQRLFSKHFAETDLSEISSQGYVVDTLEAAVWCVLTTTSYRDCVLKAINLGNDTDTVAAVAGGIAGVLYGFESIPTEWVDALIKSDEIKGICLDFYKALTPQ